MELGQRGACQAGIVCYHQGSWRTKPKPFTLVRLARGQLMAIAKEGFLKDFNWSGGLFLTGYHLALLISLPLYLAYVPLNVGLITSAFLFFVLGGLGITAGYHRFYSHKTYQPHPVMEVGLLWLGTMATQGSALRWAYDHRLHHRYVDTDKDPYRTSEGFWPSHLLWMFKKRESFEEQRVADLMKNSLVRFQDQHYALLLLLTNMVPVLLMGWLFNDYMGAVVIGLLARMFLVHHSTWFINSLAHMWGSRPYSTEHSAVNNWIVALLTMGEGYHNFHHTFAGDYRNGVRFYQYDITKIFIWLAGRLGLASGLRRVNASTIKKKLVLEDRRLMLEEIGEQADQLKMVELKKEIVLVSDRLVGKLADWEKLKQRLTSLKRSNPDRDLMKAMRLELRALKKSIRKETRSWTRLLQAVSDDGTRRVQV